jgi:phosphopantothenoylcysteine synthetase/decarboxylase
MKNNTDDFKSGVNPKSSVSYEKYLATGLEMIHPKDLTFRVYKLAPLEDYPSFIRGKDLRVGFFIKNKPVMTADGRPYEFIIDVNFWTQRNTNKEDRAYMRGFADVHLKTFHNAIKKKKTKKKTVRKKKSASKAGSTQRKFDKMKSNRKD